MQITRSSIDTATGTSEWLTCGGDEDKNAAPAEITFDRDHGLGDVAVADDLPTS